MDSQTVSIIPFEGKSKKTGKEYHAFQLQVGDWSTLIFPRSQFEFKYIAGIIGNGVEID